MTAGLVLVLARLCPTTLVPRRLTTLVPRRLTAFVPRRLTTLVPRRLTAFVPRRLATLVPPRLALAGLISGALGTASLLSRLPTLSSVVLVAALVLLAPSLLLSSSSVLSATLLVGLLVGPLTVAAPHPRDRLLDFLGEVLLVATLALTATPVASAPEVLALGLSELLGAAGLLTVPSSVAALLVTASFVGVLRSAASTTGLLAGRSLASAVLLAAPLVAVLLVTAVLAGILPGLSSGFVPPGVACLPVEPATVLLVGPRSLVTLLVALLLGAVLAPANRSP